MIVYSDDALKKLHAVILEILIEFDRICCKHNIAYIIESGTLLGSVREKGFIPWDDDADIKMLRKDYIKFCEVCKSELDTDRFFLQNYNTDLGYRWGYGKILRKDTVFLRENQEMLNMERGIFVDIFPCDNLPDRFLSHKWFTFKSFLARKRSYAPVGAKYASGYWQRMLYKMLSYSKRPVGDAYEKLAHKYLDKKTAKVRIVSWGSKREEQGFPRCWMEDRAQYEFEGHLFWGPKDYDGFLKYIYGDYMTLPPVEKRVAHSPATYVKFLDGTELRSE